MDLVKISNFAVTDYSNVVTLKKKDIVRQSDFTECDTVYIIKYQYSLDGDTIKFPKGTTLLFQGGSLDNGTIIGNKTKIEGITYHIFGHINIEGSWNVKDISTDMLISTEYEDNYIEQIFRLLDATIYNRITIEYGTYKVIAKENEHAILNLTNNTELIVLGDIYLDPNEFTNYYILQCKNCSNVKIHGSGSINADKDQHLGTTGEWGHCIYVIGSNAVTVEGLTITDAWGDGIYFGRESKNCIVRNCIIQNCRRQGISGVICPNLTVENCTIEDINGIAPAAAIDYEPNRTDIEYNFIARNLTIRNCERGILCTAPEDDVTEVGNCLIENCDILNCNRTFEFNMSHSTIIRNNRVINTVPPTQPVIRITGTTYAQIDHNYIEGEYNMCLMYVKKDVPYTLMSDNTIIATNVPTTECFTLESPITIKNNYIKHPIISTHFSSNSIFDGNLCYGRLELSLKNAHVINNKFFGDGSSLRQIILFNVENLYFMNNIINVDSEEKTEYAVFTYLVKNSFIVNNIVNCKNTNTGIILTAISEDNTGNTVSGNVVLGKYNNTEVNTVNINVKNTMYPNKGSLEKRPDFTGTKDTSVIGFEYFNTTNRRKEIWNGSNWTNMDGTQTY